MYVPNKTKKKRKEQEKFPSIPPPPFSIHLEEKRRNSETVQTLLSNHPNSDIQFTYPSQQVFPLISKNPGQPSIQPERETVPTLLNDPGVTAGKARRLSNERATDRFLEASTSRFTYDTHEPLVSMRGIRERPRLVAMSKAMRAAHVATMKNPPRRCDLLRGARE